MSYSDDDLRNAVNAVFDAYDKDKSGTLEANEITQLINDALKHMGQGRQVTQQEVNQFIAAVDKNNDGKVAKPELFEIFKRVISHKWTWSFLYINIQNKFFICKLRKYEASRPDPWWGSKGRWYWMGSEGGKMKER